jgi:prepilin-type N-terminal cleavage/methylation domain-containing protein
MTRAPRQTAAGFSMTEMLVSIAIVGVLASIAIASISHTNAAARGEAANNVATSINRAVTAYRQCGSEITISANAGASADEQSVMSLLTTHDAGVFGSPFLRGGNWPATGSNDPATYRLLWNGQFFEVLPAGTAGTGLKINNL